MHELRRCLLSLILLCALPAHAAIIDLSFLGSVDPSGATFGGVSAPIGSPFTLDIGVDDSTAGIGVYGVVSISYTLTLGTYTTVTAWTTDLVAVGAGAGMTLTSSPPFDAPGEHFLLSLSGFDAGAIFSDPSTWDTAGSSLTGDIIVRGIGGFGSPNQLSGISPYTGSLDLNVVPEPASLALLALGLAGLGFGRRKRS